MGLNGLKFAIKLFFKAKSKFSLFGLSNEELFIYVAQGAAKLPEVTFEGTKKDPELEPCQTCTLGIGPGSKFFLGLQL